MCGLEASHRIADDTVSGRLNATLEAALEAALEVALVYEEVFLDNGGCNGMYSLMGRTGKSISWRCIQEQKHVSGYGFRSGHRLGMDIGVDV